MVYDDGENKPYYEVSFEDGIMIPHQDVRLSVLNHMFYKLHFP